MIGIFDSGVGGMTVARAIEKRLPHQRLIYFGDLARSPYGSKSADTIQRYSIENTEFLLSQGARLIVIACNSAASVAADLLRARFSVPVFDVISPAVRQATATTQNGRIGIIGTRATVRSAVYERKIKEIRPDLCVFSQPCPLLVPLVEEGWLDRRETKTIVRSYLAPLVQQNIDTLVLGCTHYPLLRGDIARRAGRKTALIDSSLVLAQELEQYLLQAPLQDTAVYPDTPCPTDRENLFYVSDFTEAAQRIADRIFGRPIHLQRVSTT